MGRGRRNSAMETDQVLANPTGTLGHNELKICSALDDMVEHFQPGILSLWSWTGPKRPKFQDS